MGVRDGKYEEDPRNCFIKNIMVSPSHDIFTGRANQEDAMGWTCGKVQRNDTGFRCGNLEKSYLLEDMRGGG